MNVGFSAASQSWTVTWQENRLCLQLVEGHLVCTYFGPAQRVDGENPATFATTLATFHDDVWRTRLESSVQIGPDHRQVRWDLVDWQQPQPDHLIIRLQAQNAPLQAEHHWQADETYGGMRRRIMLRHIGEDTPLRIHHAGSFAVLLPPTVQEVTHLAGAWGAETQVQRIRVPQSALLFESRAGKTGFEQSPYVALQGDGLTYVFELAWSGNWQLHVYRLFNGWVSVSGGLNDWGLNQVLAPDDELALPEALLVAAGDLNTATQQLHDLRRQSRPDADRPVPVQFNSWYPYPGEPPVAKMKAFVEVAATLGCEVFVQDAGWYTTEQENPDEDWWIRTGDWVVNPRLFPDGLEELSEHCRRHGMEFGIWFEPEAIGPSAVVRREHPEWLHHLDGEPTPPDQRAILHLGVPQARAFVRERILAILRRTRATWMKWDFNTELRQGGWAPGLPEELTRTDPLVAHYWGLYQLQDELRAALPSLVLEMCAGGGGRFDAAILSHAHTNWMSDQTQPLKNLAIHFGSHLAHPAIECNDWLIEWPHDGLPGRRQVDERGDLAFRTRVAMLGAFGISAPVAKWSADEIRLVQTHVAWYKQRVRPLLHEGDQYLLSEAPPLDGNGEWAAIWYVAKDRSHGTLFAFRLASAHAQHVIALPGLMPDAHYRLLTPEGQEMTETGATLAAGFSIHASQPFRSVLMAVERVG